MDAIVVLCGGCLTGILSACELFAQLALHRVVPGVFLKLVPRTGAPYISVICFSVFSGALYASAAGSLVVVSQMFSLVWLTVMALFPISLLLLKFNRGRLRAASRTKLLVVVAALIVVPVVFAGNIAHQPETVGFVDAFFHKLSKVSNCFMQIFFCVFFRHCLLFYYDPEQDSSPPLGVLDIRSISHPPSMEIFRGMGSEAYQLHDKSQTPACLYPGEDG